MIPDAAAISTRVEPPEVRLSGASTAFGTDWLFRAIDLVIPSGGWLTVMGPSGSGKTTLVRLLGGLIEPTEGRALVGGRSWSSLRGPERLAMRRRFAYVQQQPGLLHATVLENVSIPLRWRGLTREAATQAARASLVSVGMRDSAARNALSLSGGERQRVAFARAIAARPEVLLLDEFTNHQDPSHGDVLETIVAGYLRNGASAVVVAHDLGQVDRIRRSSGSDSGLGILLSGRWREVAIDQVRSLSGQSGAVAMFLRRVAGEKSDLAETQS